MNKIKHFKIIFLLGAILGIIFSISSISLFHFINQYEKQKKEKEQYQLYLDNYVKSRGTVERVFSEDPPIKIEPLRLERYQVYDFSIEHHIQPSCWDFYYMVTNISDTSCQIYFQPQVDYQIDNSWYLCSNYDTGTLLEGSIPTDNLLPGESRSYWVRLEDPVSFNPDLPHHSGRFWYGHYRVVIEFAEEQFTCMEFDVPETEIYYSNPLYKN